MLANSATTGYSYAGVGTALGSDWRSHSQTICLWARYGTVSASRHLVHQVLNVSPFSGWRLRHGGGGKVVATWVDGAGASQVEIESTAEYDDGVWRHFAARHTAGGAPQWYVDGVAVAQTVWANAPTGVLVPATTVEIGRLGSAFFVGDLADVRVYTRALTANEIATIHAARGRDGIVSGLGFRAPLGVNGADVGPSGYAATPIGSPTHGAGVLRIP